jgi:hypothetical protein
MRRPSSVCSNLLLFVLLCPGIKAAIRGKAQGGVVQIPAINDANVYIHEGASFNYTISLSARPSLTAWVAVEVVPLDGASDVEGLLVASPGFIECKSDEWDKEKMCEQTIQLMAREDYVAGTKHSFTVNHILASPAPEYIDQTAAYAPLTMSVNVIDNDQAAVALTAPIVHKLGGTLVGRYSIGLRSEPRFPVAVMIAAPEDVEVNPTTIYFTKRDWHRPRQVRFAGPEPSIQQADLFSTVKHTTESQDQHYEGANTRFIYRRIANIPEDVSDLL